MTIETKTKSHPKPVVNFESILESVERTFVVFAEEDYSC